MQILTATYTCSTEFRMSLEIPQDKHYTIRDYLEEELVKARHWLEKVAEAHTERDIACETNEFFALMYAAMELSDELTYSKSRLTDKI